ASVRMGRAWSPAARITRRAYGESFRPGKPSSIAPRKWSPVASLRVSVRRFSSIGRHLLGVSNRRSGRTRRRIGKRGSGISVTGPILPLPILPNLSFRSRYSLIYHFDNAVASLGKPCRWRARAAGAAGDGARVNERRLEDRVSNAALHGPKPGPGKSLGY